MVGEVADIGGLKFSRRGEVTKTLSGYTVTFLWNGVKRRALKSSLAIWGEVGGITSLKGGRSNALLYKALCLGFLWGMFGWAS